MTVSITNVARGVRLARDSGVPLSDILENRNFTTLDIKDRAAVVKEYATSHETEARPMDSKQKIKALVAKAAWGALSGAAAGIPVAMIVRSGFMPLSKSPAALRQGLKAAFGDRSVQLGVGLMAGLGGAQGAYNAVAKLQAQESDRKRTHTALENIRSGSQDDSEAHTYGAMFGAIRHYDDPRPSTAINPVIEMVNQLARPYDKAINSFNYGRVAQEADEIGLGPTEYRVKSDFRDMKTMSENIKTLEEQHGQEMIGKKDLIGNQITRTTDEDMAKAERITEIAQKAKMIKEMMQETGRVSIMNETQQGFAEKLSEIAATEGLVGIINYMKDFKDPK